MVTKVNKEAILELKKEGLTNVEIAEMCGLTKEYISKILKPYRDQYKKYNDVKLTPEERARIVSLRKGGYTQKEVGIMVGHSQSYIRKILREENMK